jgi:two-component sensor histidine kinase
MQAAIENTGKQTYQELCFIRHTNNPVEVAFSPLSDGGKTLFLATISDVSALYDANKALEKTLQEKTVLLNEVHHRVKNNLQVMSSLLNLQANADGTNASTKRALQDSQRRLKSMALIHQLLYEREDFTYADLQQFTQKLIELLQDLMANSSSISVVKHFTSEPITVSLNQIVPFGFLITELVTNAFKHAFVDMKGSTQKPTITIAMSEVDNYITLEITDNGTGYNVHENGKKASLGSDLINIFTRQLRAKLTTQTNEGVTHSLVFQREP